MRVSAAQLVHPRRWTLRTRLVALTVVLLALISLAIGVVSTVSVRARLTSQVDQQITQAFARPLRNIDAAGEGGGGDGGGDALRVGPGGVSATVQSGQVVDSGVFDAGGAQADARGYPVTGVLTSAQQSVVVDLVGSATGIPVLTEGQRVSGLHPVTASLPGRGPYRFAVVSLSGGRSAVLGASLAGVDDAVAQLVRTELIVALAGLVLVGVLGGVVIRASLRPLTRVAATATRVSELPLARGEVLLAERVPAADTDPGTEVGQVGAALNRMLGHVGSALVARQESETRVRTFVADASHELRTPLTAIRGYAELTRRSREPVPPDVAHALGRVESEAQRMTTLVEDLLLLARLDSGRPLDSHPVDLSALVVDVTSDAHAAGPDHPLTLDLPDEAVVVPGDAARLHQVLANLLANTRTHTPPGTPVTVSLRRSPSEAVLSVVDAGPGIAPDLLPHVFARFARGDSSRARTAGSTGLGLAIVQAVAAAHHGTVVVASVPGRTAFTVTLPAAPSAPGGTDSRATATPHQWDSTGPQGSAHDLQRPAAQHQHRQSTS